MNSSNTQKDTLPKNNLLFVDIESENLTAASSLDSEVYFIVSQEDSTSKRVWYSVSDFIYYVHSNDFWLVFHNAKFDYRVLKLRGLQTPITRVLDTQVLSYLLDNTMTSYSLDALTGLKQDVIEAFVNAGVLSERVKTEEFWGQYWGDNPKAIELLVDYCKQDVEATIKLYNHVRTKLHPQVVRAYFKLQQPMLDVIITLESDGAHINRELLDKVIHDKSEVVLSLKEQINVNAGLLPELQWKNDSFVPKEKIYKSGSYINKRHSIPYYLDNEGVIVTAWEGHRPDAQPLTVYNHCPLVKYNPSPATGHTWWLLNKHCPDTLKKAKINKKTGKPSMGGSFFEKVAKKLPDWLPIGELTKVSKKLQIAESIAKHVQDDGRIYGNYNHTLTLTGRLSSSNPNLQNMPRPGKDEDSTVFRRIFSAESGHTYLCADLDQIELRMLAYYLALVEKDFGLMNEFNGAEPDAHTKNANTWGVTRTVAKTVIFLLTYGGQPALMVDRGLVKTLKEAEEIYSNVHKNQPSLQKLINKILDKARERDGVVITWGGRHLRYRDLCSSKKWEKMRAERQVFNALLQGGAGDIIHTLAVETLPIVRFFSGRLTNIVHDEISIEVPTEFAVDAQIELNKIWQRRTDLLTLPKGNYVTVNGDWNTGSNWSEVK